MLRLSDSVKRIAPSATMAISSRAKAMKRAGKDVIALAAGEPDFDTPAHIVQAAKEALDAGYTRYSPAAGMADLRAAWADYIGRARGVSYTGEQLIVTAGGKQAVFNVIYALAGPGDEVIVPAPYWVSYVEQVRAVGATPVVVKTYAQDDFKLRPQALADAITERTRLLILNSPSNPTGAVYTRAELADLLAVLIAKQVPVLSDEVYDDLVYGREFVSPVSVRPDAYELTIIVDSASKAYAMTGWRIGCAVGPQDVIAACSRLQSHSTSGPNSVAQRAVLAALTGDQGVVQDMRREFDRRRRYIVERLQAMPEIVCREPHGAFYVFPNVAAYYGRRYDGHTIAGSLDFCTLLLEHENLAIIPGVAFGDDDHVRLSYATAMPQIEEAMDRLERFLSRLS